MAINVNTGDIAWRIRSAASTRSKPRHHDTGSFNIGGSVATASGLVFIGASSDQRFHAYESKTGRLLWETKLPDAAQSNPITFLGKNGKQYVVIDANDTLVAFSLLKIQIWRANWLISNVLGRIFASPEGNRWAWTRSMARAEVVREG